MGLRGRKRRLELETEYWPLIAAGVGTVEARQAVGIGRKTGYRWRAENGGLPPVRLAGTAHSGRPLSVLERQRIATLRERSLGVREIARRIGRAPSTVSQELRGNRSRHDRNRCSAAPRTRPGSTPATNRANTARSTRTAIREGGQVIRRPATAKPAGSTTS